MHEPEHSVRGSLFFTINESSRSMHGLFLSCLLLTPELANEPRCVNQALEASLKGEGRPGSARHSLPQVSTHNESIEGCAEPGACLKH